ncbi:MAG: hypothetical protein Q8J69_04150 [Sphingobacteriaceae bacterium]|nr:hypothetical protein [Sphingobacteriaceae bacterium]
MVKQLFTKNETDLMSQIDEEVVMMSKELDVTLKKVQSDLHSNEADQHIAKALTIHTNIHLRIKDKSDIISHALRRRDA